LTIKLAIFMVRPIHCVRKFASVDYTKALSYAKVDTKMGNMYPVAPSHLASMPLSTQRVRNLKFRQVTRPIYSFAINHVVIQ